MTLTNNLVAYYTLNEGSGNALDSSGNSRTMTLTGTINTDVGIISSSRGPVSGASWFENTSFPVFNFGGSVSLSVSSWVYITSTPATTKRIWSYREGSSGTSQLRLLITPTRAVQVYADQQSITERFNFTSTGTLSLNTWHHIVFTFNGTTARLYINSVQDGTGTKNGALGNDNTNFRLLNSSGDTTDRFDIGRVDEVGVWSIELTSLQVSDLYNSGSGITYPFTPTPPQTTNALFFGGEL